MYTCVCIIYVISPDVTISNSYISSFIEKQRPCTVAKVHSLQQNASTCSNKYHGIIVINRRVRVGLWVTLYYRLAVKRPNYMDTVLYRSVSVVQIVVSR